MGLVDDSEATLELRLLLSVGAGEETDELDGDGMILKLKLDMVELNDDDEASLELNSELAGMTDELVTDTGTLELELPRELKDVELTDVLDMGYRALFEVILLLDLETRPVLSGLAALLAIVLSAELVESLELDDAGSLELLGIVLPTRLDGVLELGDDPGFVDNLEFDGSTVLANDLELEGADGRKMTVAKISPRKTLWLCALN
jgi:hypothetical protein